MNKTRITAALIAALCSGSLMAETVVTVNGSKIDSSDINRRAKIVIQQSQGQVQDSAELRQYIASQMVEETVIAQEAKRLGLDKSKEFKDIEAAMMKEAKDKGYDKQPDFKQTAADARNRLLMQAYAINIIRKNPVTDAQVQERYNQWKARYQGQQEVQLGEIVTDKAEQAQAAIKELGAKKSFADVAKKYSIDPRVKAGETPIMDFIPLPDLQERTRIYQAVNSLKKGEFTRQPLSDNNIHVVFYMNDRRAITVPPLDQLREAISGALADERIGEQVGQIMRAAKIVPAK